MTSKMMAILLGSVIVSAFVMSLPSASRADNEPIDLVPVAVEVPEALPDPRPVVVKEHDLNEEDVEKLARLLWSSPLRYEGYKKALVWVVMNRAEHGEPFGTSIQDCINRTEFAFYDSHAHRSEENLKLARQAMNEWLSRKEGYNVGEVIRLDAFYIRFEGKDNRQLKLLDINKDPIAWDPAE